MLPDDFSKFHANLFFEIVKKKQDDCGRFDEGYIGSLRHSTLLLKSFLQVHPSRMNCFKHQTPSRLAIQPSRGSANEHWMYEGARGRYFLLPMPRFGSMES